jgi:ADP-ribose pyrophosphatase YjhB (NUDIX family)
MPKAPAKTTRLLPTKEVSVMAWIEDSDQNILLVRQAAGLKLWTLPGGKVKRGESLVKALKREVYEETALRVQIGSLLGVLDRRDKDAITLLFAAIPNYLSVKTKQKQKEIKEAGFQKSLPEKASPSAKYFLSAKRSPVKKAPKGSGLNTSISDASGTSLYGIASLFWAGVMTVHAFASAEPRRADSTPLFLNLVIFIGSHGYARKYR